MYIGIDGQYVITVVTNPAGTPVDGQFNTFDYSILTSVTLTCMVTMSDGLPITATNYYWTATNCYTRYGGVLEPCFYSGGHTGQVIIRGTNLLARDTGTINCTATIGDVNYSSDSLTLRISGEL